jgi:alpha-L-fucosidase
VPSERHLAWHQLEYYGFIHFTINTFTDKEWGYGDESPQLFNPTALDARQWARVARDAGMKGLILTAKHHDGFCLWPSAFTSHSVRQSPWRDGDGDLVQEVADACREFGLRFGVYLSPWDRNHGDYGRPAYLEYYRNQLRELLTRYGPVFEVWFDGANGGTGYYGGARENRRIDNATYYDWENTWSIVRELQPMAVTFSDAGPDIRWVGNERGYAFETSWMALNRREIYPGYPKFDVYAPGRPDGTDWVPPEVDVSIRPGWFYHAAEDEQVKTVDQLIDIYYASVGRSANLLLNIPPDRRGLIHEIDVERLMGMRAMIDATFKTDLAPAARASATNVRGGSRQFGADHVLDGNLDTYWATDDGVTTAGLTLEFNRPTRFDHVLVQEHVPLGQRVRAWNVEAEVEGVWITVTRGTTIGYKRILRNDPITAQRVRLNVTESGACPVLSTFSLFLADTP